MFRDNSSWMLDLQGLKALLGLFPFLLVDLSADRLNHQLTHFWSWRPDPLAEDVDSLTTVWKGMDAYVFPPFQLIHKILTKVQNEGAAVLVVAPVWFQQAWHPVLLGILVELLVLLPTYTQISTAPDSSPHPMSLNQRLKLAWLVSGDQTRIQSFQRKQNIWCQMPEVLVPRELTSPGGKGSVTGAVGSKLIHFHVLRNFWWIISQNSSSWCSSTLWLVIAQLYLFYHDKINSIPAGKHSLVVEVMKGSF